MAVEALRGCIPRIIKNNALSPAASPFATKKFRKSPGAVTDTMNLRVPEGCTTVVVVRRAQTLDFNIIVINLISE